MNWHLNKIQYPVYNLGPGKRIGIWVQGCSIHCTDCINQSLWEKDKGKQVSVIAVYELLNQLMKDYNGITISGGEPFDQYPQLMAFAMLLKRKLKLNILCYSGYELRELETKFPDMAFYKCIDYLIDGRFMKDLPSCNSLKGSENQLVYAFVEGKAIKTSLKNNKKSWSLNCTENGIYMAGIPIGNELETIENQLLQFDICSQKV